MIANQDIRQMRAVGNVVFNLVGSRLQRMLDNLLLIGNEVFETNRDNVIEDTPEQHPGSNKEEENDMASL